MLAGDASFIEKAHARIESFVSKAEILVLSTHNEGTVREWATRVLWIEQGRVVRDGPVDEVLDDYIAHSHSAIPVAAA